MAFLDNIQAYWPALIGLYVSYFLCRYVYRLYFHPLAKFPGPKLPAMTLWVEFYYDAICRGQYIFKIREWHEKYGPIIRITPDELHVNDPEFIPELYPSGGRKRDKYRRSMQLFGFTEAAISTVGHDVHRVRRGAMSRMFSKDSVRRLEPIMQNNFQKLLDRLEGIKTSGKPVNLLYLYSAFTNDLITEYAFGVSYNWLEAPEFNNMFFNFITSFHEMGAIANMFSWWMPLINSLPAWANKMIDPGYVAFQEFVDNLATNISGVMQRHQEGKDNKTVFDEILDSSLPDSEKQLPRLLQESINIGVAGTETTAWALSVIQFHLLQPSNAPILHKLKSELQQALPDLNAPVYLKEVEPLPYLNAVMLEGLRLGMGTSNRQFRIAPDEALSLTVHARHGTRQGPTHTYIIPPGTPVAMSTPWIHLNASIFPDPLSFRPERFLENPRLKRYLMSFSQGSRQCLGMQLAYAELYLVLAGVWRRFGGVEIPAGEQGCESPMGRFELFETGSRDVEMEFDLFVPYGKRDSKGIRCVLKD